MMEKRMKRAIATLVICGVLAGCSTAGGIYKKGDQENGEFSAGRTILTILGVAAGVAAVRGAGGGGGSQAGQGYAWDYQPGNGQWACRDKSNGQYAYDYQCAGVPRFDYWP
jgi:hypothetical protein